jgi:hypothetical protein
VVLKPFDPSKDVTTDYSIPPVATGIEKNPLPITPNPFTDDIGIYDEYLNDKKLYGANIDVLNTLSTIQFSSAGDGSLRQNIAYIKFYGDPNIAKNVIDGSIFRKNTPNSELLKCLSTKSAKDCTYTFDKNIKITPDDFIKALPTQEVGINPVPAQFSPEAFNTKEIAKDIDKIKTYEQSYNTFKEDLPPELGDLLPVPPQTRDLIENKNLSQDFRERAELFKVEAEKTLNLTPQEARSTIEKISNALNIVQGLNRGLDNYIRIASTILDKTGKIIDIWEFFKSREENLETTPTEFSIVPQDDTNSLPLPPDFIEAEPLGEDILSADVIGVENISTYSCKEVVSKKEGIWQFMFNPSELNYSYSSDYAEADTWANSDGQPMHWKGNKNPELQFSDILLNGYMFGRKVESLSQGLKELMLFSEGAKTYRGSPPILEFIWGSKRFGPCVMKDLSFKENMWDGGELVGATCSFKLVAIPKWIVNDGYVDIFDPARTPVFIPRESPTSGAEEPIDDTTETVTPGSDSDGGGGKPDPVVTTRPAPQVRKDEYCQTIAVNRFKELKAGYEATPRIEKYLKDFQFKKDRKQLLLYLSQDPYKSWVLQTRKAFTEFETKFLSKIDSFLDYGNNEHCGPPQGRPSADFSGRMVSINPIKYTILGSPGPDFSYIDKAVKCYKRLYEYVLNEATTLCYTKAPTSSEPQKNPDNSKVQLCLSNIVFKDATDSFTRNTSTIVGIVNVFAPLTNIPYSKIQDQSEKRWPKSKYSYVTMFDKLEMFKSYYTRALEVRSDLKQLAKELERIKLYSLQQHRTKIKYKSNSCAGVADELTRIHSSATAWSQFQSENLGASYKDYYNFIRLYMNKCVFPANNINKKISKILGCKV